MTKKESTAKKETKEKVEDTKKATVENEVKDEKTNSKKPEKKSDKKKTSKPKVEVIVKEEIKIVEENVDFKDRYIRLSADFDNYRKRTLKEKADLIKSASEVVLTKLLPLIDDLERAVKAAEETKEENATLEGVNLVYSKFQEFLKSQGVKKVEALHKDFDPEIHEAITKFPAPEEKLKGKVLDVIESGYLLNDKIIRFAKVVVGE